MIAYFFRMWLQYWNLFCLREFRPFFVRTLSADCFYQYCFPRKTYINISYVCRMIKIKWNHLWKEYWTFWMSKILSTIRLNKHLIKLIDMCYWLNSFWNNSITNHNKNNFIQFLSRQLGFVVFISNSSSNVYFSRLKQNIFLLFSISWSNAVYSNSDPNKQIFM